MKGRRILPSVIWLAVGLGLSAMFATLYANSATEFAAGFSVAGAFTALGSILMYITQRPFGGPGLIRNEDDKPRWFLRYRLLVAFVACAPLVVLSAFWLVSGEPLYVVAGAGMGVTLGSLSALNWRIGRARLEHAGFRW